MIGVFSTLILSLLFLSVPLELEGQQMKEVKTVTLKSPGEIKYASAVYEAIDAMSNRVRGCMEDKNLLPNQCICLHKESLENVKAAYVNAVKKFPTWKDKLVYYKKADDPAGYNVVFDGLDKQLEVNCE